MQISNEPFSPLIVGIGGTSRPSSTSERAVAAALKVAEGLGARTRLFGGEFVSQLPLYVAEKHNSDANERAYIDAVRQCHGIIVSTPGYHGSLSGPIKNILDILEATARDDLPYLEGRPFGCVVTAYGWQACGSALISLRLIAHALRAWPTPFGASFNASTPLFKEDGSCIDETVAKSLSLVATQVVDFARWRAADRRQRALGAPLFGSSVGTEKLRS
jgi:FMN reductase